MTFTTMLTIGDKIFAWDSDGRAWRRNEQYIEGGHVDGGAYTAYAMKDNFRCKCGKYSPAGSKCKCGKWLPATWVREYGYDHPEGG